MVIALTNYCQLPRLISAPNHRTRGTPMKSARAGEARPKGKSEGMTGRSLLQTRQRKVFPATGGGAAVPPSSFINLTFTSHTGSLLLSSPKKVTSPFVPLRSLRPLRHKKSETPIATQHRNKSLAISSRSGPCGRALTPSVAAKPPATPSYRAGVRNFASSPAWIAASPAAAAARAPCP